MRDSENGKNGGKLSTKRENEYTQQSPVLLICTQNSGHIIL